MAESKIKADNSADKIIIQPKGVGFTGLNDDFVLTDDDLKAVEKSSGVYEATGVYIKAAEVKQRTKKKYAFLMAYNPKKPYQHMINLRFFQLKNQVDSSKQYH